MAARKLSPVAKLRAIEKNREKRRAFEKSHKKLQLSSYIFTRWEAVKSAENLKTNDQVANLLLDLWYNQAAPDVHEKMFLNMGQPLSDSTESTDTSTLRRYYQNDQKAFHVNGQLLFDSAESANTGSLTSEAECSVDTDQHIVIKVEKIDSTYPEDSAEEKVCNESINHEIGVQTEYDEENTDNVTDQVLCMKSIRVRSRGFRPNYANMECSDDDESDSELTEEGDSETDTCSEPDYKDFTELNDNLIHLKSETEIEENTAPENMLMEGNKRKNDREKKKKPKKEEDPDYAIDIDDDNECRPKRRKKDTKTKKAKLAKKDKKTKKAKLAETENVKKPWVHIDLEDHKEKYKMEIVGSFERKNRKSDLTEEFYSCLLCGRFKSTAKDMFKNHIEKHVNGVLECEKCDFVGCSKMGLLRHKMTSGHMPTGHKYVCDICGTISYTRESRLAHMGKEHNNPQFQCRFCGEKFTTKPRRHSHYIAVHTDEMKYCSSCRTDCQAMSDEEYRKHVENCKPGHQCDQCGAVLTSKIGLKCHMLSTHMDIRKYQCQQCPYAAKSAKRLREHTLVHSNIHPYSCDQCTFTCVQACQLKSHMRTHSGEKPFKCTKCKFAAAWNVQLKQHMTVHDLEGTVMCQQCDIMFKNEKAIRMHEKKDH